MLTREESIRKTFEIFKPEGVIEVRAVDPYPFSGYFKDREKLVSALKKHDDKTWYFVMNEIDDACYSREQCERILQSTKKTKTTSDKEITRLKWILIDADPVRAAGVSSTNDEKAKALETIGKVHDFLKQVGFSEPVVADSGNGYHLLYSIDLPPKASSEIKKFLQALDMLFSDDSVQIDTSVFNPSRITKVYGTVARKGANTEERPHRASGILRIPDDIKSNSLDLIKKVSSKLPEPEKPSYSSTNIQSNFNIDDFIQNHGIAVDHETMTNGRRKIILECCPFDENHKAPDAAIFIESSGAIGFNCFHNSCQDKSWKDLRLLFEPDCYNKPERENKKRKRVKSVKTDEIETIDAELIEIREFTEDEFNTTAPLEYLLSIYNDKNKRFLIRFALDKLKQQAKKAGITSFVSWWNDYLKDYLRNNNEIEDDTQIAVPTKFPEQPIELYCDEYLCDSRGIRYTNSLGFEVVVCHHPITILKRYVNVDTREHKLEIAFCRAGKWKESIILPRSQLASAQKITELSDMGIAVDSNNAKELVKYITFLEERNYDKLGETNSVGRLGWIKGYGFSPYVSGLQFDGDLQYKHIFQAVQGVGNHETWLTIAKESRAFSVVVRIALAASFASVLVEPLGCLPFFCHLWATAGAGKTVSLMLAASVWANPSMGEFIRSFNNTNVGLEVYAGFCNSLPLCLDELEIEKDKSGFDKIIYMLTEGFGRGRGAKTGGLQKVYTWRNSIITTGEHPIINSNSGGGAVIRVVDVDFSGQHLFQDPKKVADTIRLNYGTAGKLFVEQIKDRDDEIHNYYQKFYSDLIKKDIDEKQAASGALILTADRMIEKQFFKDGVIIGVDELAGFLTTKSAANVNRRALEWLENFVAGNSNHFNGENGNIEIWGEIDENCNKLYYIDTFLNKHMTDAGYSHASFRAWAKQNGLLETDEKRNSKKKRVKGTRISSWCLCLKTDELKKFEEKNEAENGTGNTGGNISDENLPL